jgi:hypothetical protein
VQAAFPTARQAVAAAPAASAPPSQAAINAPKNASPAPVGSATWTGLAGTPTIPPGLATRQPAAPAVTTTRPPRINPRYDRTPLG